MKSEIHRNGHLTDASLLLLLVTNNGHQQMAITVINVILRSILLLQIPKNNADLFLEEEHDNTF